MLSRIAVLAAVLLFPPLARAESNAGAIDWNRRVLVGHGQGAPDLNAPSIAVARLGAERAAKLDAYRNALEQLKGLALRSGGTVGSLLQGDAALSSRLDGKLKGVKPVKTHYFSDGGVSLDIEVPLDELPAEIAKDVQVPPGVAPLAGAQPAPSPPAAQGSGGDLVQVAQGQAAVLNGDRPAAREKAIEDALRHAIEMAVGTRVTSTTEVQDFQSRMDRVVTHSQGFVRRYEIVGEAQDGDVVQTTVRAFISSADLDKDLEAMGLLMARKGFPRTMALIAEQNIGMAHPQAAWMQGDRRLVSADLRIAETVVLDGLKAGGFGQLVDPDVATEKAVQVGGIATDISSAQVRRLRSLTGAEVVLIGQAIATSRGEMPELGAGWRSCSASISGRAVNTDNGDILATGEVSQNAVQLDDLTCGKEAIRKAARAFAGDMVRKIGERWSRDVSGGNDVHVTVRRVSSFRQASEFRAALGQAVRGVKGVSQRSFSNGTQELDVTLVGSTEQLAQELESRHLGKFSVRVLGVTANTLDVELGKE